MPSNIKLRPKAENDLADIYVYSAKEWGSAQADAYLQSIDDAFQQLNQYPKLGRDYGLVRPNVRAYDINSHVILYKKIQSGIVIIRILHGSMDVLRHL
jgi:toxin ParE1/3/4